MGFFLLCFAKDMEIRFGQFYIPWQAVVYRLILWNNIMSRLDLSFPTIYILKKTDSFPQRGFSEIPYPQVRSDGS